MWWSHRSFILRVVGIDPGLNITGYGVVEGDAGSARLIEAGYLKSDERDAMPVRIKAIYDDVLALFEEVKPEAVAIEELYVHYNHPRTAIVMGHMRGAIMLAAAQCGVPVLSYPATMVKRSLTGNGHAAKSQMQRMIEAVLGLSKTPEPADVADALAVAICHANHAPLRSATLRAQVPDARVA